MVGQVKAETIREFQEAVKTEYGKDLDFAEASEIITGIANLYYLLHVIDRRKQDLK